MNPEREEFSYSFLSVTSSIDIYIYIYIYIYSTSLHFHGNPSPHPLLKALIMRSYELYQTYSFKLITHTNWFMNNYGGGGVGKVLNMFIFTYSDDLLDL